MGTATHGADVDIIADTMRRLRTRWDGRITLEIIGAKSAAADWYARLDVPASVAHSYPRFVQWLRAQAKRWVLGVAPLIGSRFNAAKSVLKYLDYAALGLPSILSDVEAYSSLRAQPYARLARNAPAPWYFATSALLRDESLAHKIACGAKGYVRGSHTLGVQATKRRAIWMQLTERPAFHESRKATYA